MVGLNKYEGKARRQMRRSRKGAPADLANRFRERVIPNKRTPERHRIDNEDGSFYLQDRYYDEDEND